MVHCRIRIKGHLNSFWQQWFEQLEIMQEEAGQHSSVATLKITPVVAERNDHMQHSTEADANAVTVHISVQAKPGREKDLEEWLKGVGQAASQFAGHHGLTVLRPSTRTSADYVYIFRFDTYAHLKQWEDSEVRREWVEQLQDLTARPARKQIVTGLEYWFTLPDAATIPPPPRYKMVLLTLLVIYPLSTFLSSVFGPCFHFLPSLLRGLPISALLVLLMTYAIMPCVTRIFARWLFPPTRKTSNEAT